MFLLRSIAYVFPAVDSVRSWFPCCSFATPKNPAMPDFQVTQRCYRYRRYRVRAPNWQEAKHRLAESCPRNGEFASAESPGSVVLRASTFDNPQGVFFDEVISIDSGDGGQTFYEA